MRARPLLLPLVSLALAGAVTIAERAGALPWPPMAARALAGLFMLVALTRVAGDFGLRAQVHARYGVAGLAATAAAWFIGAAVMLPRPSLAILGGLHVVAAALAVVREPDPAVRFRGGLNAAITAQVVSLLALASLPAEAGVLGAPALPALTASALIIAALFVARGRTGGLALAAAAGLLGAAVAARTVWMLPSADADLQLALLPAATTMLAAVPVASALTRRLPAIWAVLAPAASARTQTALCWLTYPVMAAVASAVVAVG